MSHPSKSADNSRQNDAWFKQNSPWIIVQSYYTKYLEKLVRHQLESYNHFIGHQLEKTIEMFNPVHITSPSDPTIHMYITFTNFRIIRPHIHETSGTEKILMPQEARIRNCIYSSQTTVNINIHCKVKLPNSDVVTAHNKTLSNIHIGRIPIMVKSIGCNLTHYAHLPSEITGECIYETGGYFIINGSEKVVISQVRPAENRIFCYKSINPKYSYSAELRSIPDTKCISPKQLSMCIIAKNDGFGCPIHMVLPRLKKPVPLFIVFRALGIETDKDICNYIVIGQMSDGDMFLNHLCASIMESCDVRTKLDAIQYLISHTQTGTITTALANPSGSTEPSVHEAGSKRYMFIESMLESDLFPHCTTRTQKLYFLGYMANMLLKTHLGIIPSNDRDSCINQRIDTTGVLLNNLYRNYFNKLVKDMEKYIMREIDNGSWRSTNDYVNIVNMTNIYKIIKSMTIENGIKRALSTGDFSIKYNTNKVGVAQVLSRQTYLAAISHLRRVSTPPDKSGKLIPPRKLHGTTWGYLCPFETPEGHSVGIVKNLSIMTHITLQSTYLNVLTTVKPYIHALEELTPVQATGVKVFINGVWIGCVIDEGAPTQLPAYELYLKLKRLKCCGHLNIYTSIVFNVATLELRILCDAGRLTRPLLRVVGDNKLVLTSDMVRDISSGKLTWDDLATNGRIAEAAIEYIDAEEQSYCVIASSISQLEQCPDMRFTHCEIHPSTILGVIASCIPFPEHNQSPRITYQCAQQKQAMGMYTTNYKHRLDKTAYTMTYPTCPLVDTRIMNILRLNQIPAGSNVTVAIMTYTGYNQEDSILINQGSIDRGLFQINIYHTEKDEDKQKMNGDEEIRCKPDKSKTQGLKCGNYDKVNDDGIIDENVLVENNDIIIFKVAPIKENKNDHTKIIKYDDKSKQYHTTEPTYVDKAFLGKNGEGYTIAKVRLRTLRKPVIGDKFSSRHGQKGTIGNVIPEKDMPYTSTGERPDIIINPHAIPSRMTIGQLKETLLGMVLVQLGLLGDGTSFSDFTVENISKMLVQLGYTSNGNKIMYDGITGEQLASDIFMGPTFYQRLKHMVADKQHSRACGTMVKLTRQPPEGRSRNGGLRFGEMEKDATVSHGAARFTRERLYDVSDAYSVAVCKGCGMTAVYNPALSIYKCTFCENTTDFAYVQLPYSCKILFQELMTMNVAPRIITRPY